MKFQILTIEGIHDGPLMGTNQFGINKQHSTHELVIFKLIGSHGTINIHCMY